MNKQANTSEIKRWLIVVVTISALLAGGYTLLHIKFPGKESIPLSQEEIDFILAVKSDDSIAVADQLEIIDNYFCTANKNLHFSRVYSKYKLPYNKLSESELKSFLQNIQLEQPSLFWLNDHWSFLEIIFWSFFGVISSLLFHGAEAIRLNKFSRHEQVVHLSKLIYSPLVAIVIIFSGDVALNQGNVDLDGFSYWVIVWSFILGFYSRKAIDLLDRVKGLLFKSSDPINIVSSSSKSAETSVPDSNYIKLSEKEQHQLVKEWMIHKSDDFEQEYDLTGTTAGHKTKDGIKTNVYCIIFEVLKKKTSTKSLPKTISYKGYVIPTDIEESPETEGTNNSLPLASSISRKGVSGFGTLGIKVIMNKKEYLMSCYHVLFPEELAKNQKQTDSSSTTGNSAILCPNEGSQLGNASEGQLNKWVDIGFTEISPGVQVLDEWESQIGPYGERYLDYEDEKNKTYVQYWGAGSNKLIGRKIESAFSNQPIKYVNGKIEQTIKGLVVLDGPAKSGDSGAPVFDVLGNFVGIIVASNKKKSYVISLVTIEDNYPIKIKTI